ncbi:tetratricopeptide repeat protein [Solwaraspora sp. WMMD1047]|uniref:tetratricopeptide repeat protein n=1 Tax=Solwaraspora sp. WMMD1047 TaxID=3016102 RepID=UPI002415EE04|nr:tetratricopeptide repeat protein [Solwaraspora sp. WMMD1047]MDG4832031.1 tetratricopeptide repeat protein [Solwaraspora sp. WMMD1047]
MTQTEPARPLTELPDPSQARNLDELIERLRLLKIWAGDPSYETIKDRINAEPARPAAELVRKNTVADCFKVGRRRVNTDLVVAVVQALQPDAGYVAQWRQVLRIVLAESRAAVQVRAHDRLPADIDGFTGRAAELDRLLRIGPTGDDRAQVVVIEGMAGVGKTGFAVHAAHRLAGERAVDRVLFVNLRGFHPDPGQPPADPGAVLDSFLRLLDVPGQRIPHALPDRRSALRRQLTGRRVLIVLDNAADEEQVRPLLPGLPGSLTLVTSRRRLTGLRPTLHLRLDVFTHREATDFLSRAVPEVPLGEDPEALDRVARRCGRLPLALGLLAAHMRTKPGWTCSDHADWLDQRHRMHRLDTEVGLALTMSYQGLEPARRELFRLLAVHPGQDLDPYAAAALTGVDLAVARDVLRRLADEHLLQRTCPDRFGFHDLVRAYAMDRSQDEDRPAARRDAVGRLLDHYLATAAAAMDALVPAEQHRRPRPTRPADGPVVDDPEAARDWLDAERVNLIAATGLAATDGWPRHATGLAATLFRYLETRGDHGDAVTVHSHARRAARDSGDLAAEAQALTDLGVATRHLGNYRQALDHLRRAVGLAQRAGHREGTARALANLGLVYRRLGEYPHAIAHYEQAREVFREIDDRVGEAQAVAFLGVVYELSGRFEEAAEHQRQALTLCREIGDRTGEAYALGNLGFVYQRLGSYQAAVEHLEQALASCQRLGDRHGQGHAYTDLGVVHQRLGHHPEAIAQHRLALAVFRETGDRGGEAEARNGLGEALRASGRPVEARAEHRTALALATDVGDRYEQARAHDGLAHAHQATGDPDRARRHWERALAHYADLGAPEAVQVRAALAGPHGS